ncbi:hypothetical protein SAMN02745166_02753 [Prosthecobacter debontii]|uniref:Uncharacterized protein n=1 Tax=Prosthecobacter debontii TaxID=48467 RepID=A0A1T4YAW7_9BACT|nr:hypothetical protein [Prosthecobacter debontii]SKA98415.1 hypothetical protein SAMN02745166_02753 [Prosthecobacter debontii]
MAISQIVNENQLDHWVRANSRIAQGLIVELVWRLVCASCPRPTHRRFPLGDSIGQHGADGELETALGHDPFVPEGKSHWEIGTNNNARQKANDDYGDSTLAVPPEVRKEATFVFVTPLSGLRDWKDTWKQDGIETWINEKKSRNEWMDIRVIDGAQLIDWVFQFPAIGHWLGTSIGLYLSDFDTAESHWKLLRGFGTPPDLCTELFTVGRANAEAKLRRLILDRNDTELRFDTRFPRHPKDYISAFVAALPDDERLEVQNRVLIFESEQAFKHACSLSERHVLVADFDLSSEIGAQLIQRAKQRHAVIYSSLPGGLPHGNACELIQPRVHEMKEALVKAGYQDERARMLTNRAGRDLNILLRLVQGLSVHPDWATQSEAADLAIAQLIGEWEDENKGDREAIEELSGNGYGEWIDQIRQAASAKAAPLEFAIGRWKFTSRYEPWIYLGNLIGPDILERFKVVAIKVLSELDPRLGLPKEERFAASFYGRSRIYSHRVREGIAETLALLGSHGESLTSCRGRLPQNVATQVVRELLADADSHRWASLNDVLPLLAEASPDEFLRAVGGASEKPDEPFSGVFSEEGDWFSGGTFITGLLWALESLAWSESYLIRVCGILSNLASVDPGGNWSNRPSNSLRGILLPWFPQTAANPDRRHAAVRSIIRDHSDVGWRLLLQLLPENHSTGHPTHRPKWQNFVPENWEDGVTNGQRLADEGFYADLALEIAGNDPVKLTELLEFFFYIHPRFSNFAENYRKRLLSEGVLSLPEEQRLSLWIEIASKISNHRKYADSDAWMVPEDLLLQLEAVAEKLKPQQLEVRHRRLFSGRDSELYEEKGNWQEQRQLLLTKRIDALKEIQKKGGIHALQSFWRSVESPHEVGNACGADEELAHDAAFLPTLLESETDTDVRFAVSYTWRRFQTKSWDWIDSMDRSGWTVRAKVEFFVVLPAIKKVWQQAELELGYNQAEYWKRVRIQPSKDEHEGLDYAIEQLLANGRADAAIQCLWLEEMWVGPYPELALKSLETFDPSINHIDVHEICEVFHHLQKINEIDEARLAYMEVKFLALLDRFNGARPRTLYRQLSERPEFFCEVIRMIYRSRHKVIDSDSDQEKQDENLSEANETKGSMVRNAYRLLNDWNHPPGLCLDGDFDDAKLRSWIASVKEICTASGHWEVASHQIGEVIYYTPKDENGLWREAVCELLDSKDDPEFRMGLRIRIFNSRGVHGFSGGKEEVELAEKWERIASQAEDRGFCRLGATLRSLAQNYREDAEQSVIRHRYEFD